MDGNQLNINPQQQINNQGNNAQPQNQPPQNQPPQNQQEQVNAIIREMRLSDVDSTTVERKGLGSLIGTPEYADVKKDLELVGFNNDRNCTFGNLFTIYLLGKRDSNYTFEEALKVVPGYTKENGEVVPAHPNFAAEMQGFKDFLKSHPLKGPLDPNYPDEKGKPTHRPLEDNVLKTNIHAWIDVFTGAAKKFDNVRMPDIDYTNPEQVLANEDKLQTMSLFTIDFDQEFAHVLNFNSRHTESYEGGRTGITKTCSGVDAVCNLMRTHSIGYNIKAKEANIILSNQGKVAKDKASARITFGIDANERFRGKLVKDVASQQKNIQSLYTENLGAVLTGITAKDRRITPDLAIRFMKNSDPAYYQYYNEDYQQAKETCIKEEINGNHSSAVLSYANEILTGAGKGAREQYKSIFVKGKSAKELYNEVNKPENGALLECASAAYSALFIKQMRDSFFEVLGKSPWELIKIDGKTVAQLYQKKYKNLTEQERETMYKVELAGALLAGNKKITFDKYFINKEGTEFVFGGEQVIVDDYEGMARSQKFLHELKNVNTELNSLKTALDSSDIAPLREAKPIHDQMVKTLSDLIENSSPSQTTYEKFRVKFEQYKTLHRQYFAAQEELMTTSVPPASAEDMAKLAALKTASMGQLEEKMAALDAAKEGVTLTQHELEGTLAGYHGLQSVKKQLETGYKIRTGKNLSPEMDTEFYLDKHEWLNHIEEYGTLSEENYAELDKVALLSESLKYQVWLTEISNDLRELDDQVMSDSNLTGRPTTAASVFMFWAIGEKGYSIDDAAKVLRGQEKDAKGNLKNPDDAKKLDQLKKEFLDYIKTTPLDTRKKETEAEAKDRAKKWLTIYDKAKEAMMRERIPDIDFSDPRQVKPYFGKLFLLKQLSGEGVQTWEDLMVHDNRGFNMYRIGEDVNDNVWSTRRFYQTMQGLMGTILFDGYSGGSMATETATAIGSHGPLRAYAEYYARPLKGKTIGEIYEERKDELIILEDAVQSLKGKIKENEYEDTFDVTSNLAFLYGYNKEKTIQTVAREMEGHRNETDLNYKYSVTWKIAEFRDHTWDNGVMQELSSLPKNAGADEMKEFLDKKDDNGVAYKDHLTDFIRARLVRSCYVSFALESLGYTPSDYILINGQSARQLYAATKYQDVNDPKKLERLLSLEALKAIADGEATISFRNIEMDANHVPTEKPEPILVYLSKEDMKTLSNRFATYEVERDNLLSELKEMKKVLASTQEDPEANFESGRTEGNAAYVAYAKELNNCILLLSNDSSKRVSVSDIKTHLSELSRKAGAFAADQRGMFFGLKSEDGKKRVYEAEKVTQNLAGRYNEIRKPIDDCKLFVHQDNPSFKDMEYFSARRFMESILNKAYRTQIDLENAKFKKVQNDLRIKWTNLEEALKQEDDKKYSEAEKLAKTYIEKFVQARLDITKPGMNGIFPDYDDLRMVEHYEDHIKELAANPVFVEFMKENPEKCVQTWKDVAKKAGESNTEYEKQFTDLEKGYKSYLHVVANLPDVPENANIKPEDRLRQLSEPGEVAGVEFKDLEIANCYDNLARIVMLQVLKRQTEESKLLREEIAKEPELFNTYLAEVSNRLKGMRALEGENIDKIEQKIDNEAFAKNATEVLYRNKKEQKAAKENEWKNSRNQTLQDLSFVHTDETLTEEQYQAFVNATGMEAMNPLVDKLSAAADHLIGAHLSFTRDEKRKEIDENGVEHEVEVKNVPVEKDLQNEVFSNAGFAVDRAISTHNDMVFFAMSKGYSFKEAYKLALTVPELDNDGNITNKEELNKANNLRNDFYEFCEKNPMHDQNLTVEEVQKSTDAWAKVYLDATNKMREYRFPDINFHDPKQVFDNLEELYMLSRICIDVDQDFAKVFNAPNKINAYSRAYQACGEKKFNEARNFWGVLGCELAALDTSYLSKPTKGYLVNHGMEALRTAAMKNAMARATAAGQLNNLSGKTLGEIYDAEQGGIALQKDLINNMENHVDPDLNDNLDPRMEIGMVTRYLLGDRDPEIEQIFEENIRQVLPKTLKDYQNAQNNNIRTFRDRINVNSNEITSLLAVPDDDAEAMKTFADNMLELNGGVQKTGKEWALELIESKREGVIQDNTLVMLKFAKIKKSDIFLIDDKTPEELFGQKYANVEDSTEREKLYYLEVLKAIASGNHNVKVRQFVPQSAKLVEKPAVILTATTANLQRVVDNIHTYEAGGRDFVRQLTVIQNSFKNWQADQNANFNDDGIVEGGDEYQEMTRWLHQTIKAFRNEKTDPKITRETIEKCFENLMESAKEYEKTHTGWFVGRWSNKGTERLKLSKEIQKLVPELRRVYNNLRSGFEQNIVCTGSTTLQKAPLVAALRYSEEMQQNFNIEVKDPDAYKQEYLKEEMRYQIAKREMAPYPNNVAFVDKYENARDFLLGEKKNKLANNLLTEDDLEDMKKMEQMEADYASNPAFQSTFSADRNFAKENWREIEQRTHQKRVHYRSLLSQRRQDYTLLSAFVAGVDGNPHPENMEEYRQQIEDNIVVPTDEHEFFLDDNGKQKYERLAGVLLAQLFSLENERGRNALQAFVADRFDNPNEVISEEMLNYIQNILMNDECLNERNYKKTMAGLEDGSLIQRMIADPNFKPEVTLMKNVNRKIINEFNFEVIEHDNLNLGGEKINKDDLLVNPIQNTNFIFNNQDDNLINNNNIIDNNNIDNSIDDNIIHTNNNIINTNIINNNIDNLNRNEEKKGIINGKPGINRRSEVIDLEDEDDLDNDNIIRNDDKNNIINENEIRISKPENKTAKMLKDYGEEVKVAEKLLGYMGKGLVNDDGEFWQDKVDCFIKIVTASEIMKNGLKPGETPKSVEKNLLEKKIDRKAMLLYLDDFDGKFIVDNVKRGLIYGDLLDYKAKVTTRTDQLNRIKSLLGDKEEDVKENNKENNKEGLKGEDIKKNESNKAKNGFNF